MVFFYPYGKTNHYLQQEQVKIFLTSLIISLPSVVETENKAKRSSYALAAMKQPL